MNLEEKELKFERERLDETVAVIDKLISEKNVNIDEYKSDIVKRKRFLWEQQNEFYDGDLQAAMNDEDFSVNLINKDIIKVYKLYRSKETPYFSRVDFSRDGDVDSYYIGLTGIDVDFSPVVYDWRAPVANLYYNYGLGSSKYEVPDGVVEGETLLKRQFDIKMGKLLSAYDSSIDSRDELLESVLAHNSSEQMKNIVSTIQREQNEIIRYGGKANLIVEGVAGSGKTSVAMHRIAYLLYNHEGLTNKNVLILSPNTVFSNYISNVLPELGEENVMTTTFDDFAGNYIKGAKVESIMEFVERHYEVGSNIHDDAITGTKVPGRYKDRLNDFLGKYFDSLKFTKKIGLKTKFITSAELNEIKMQVPKKLSIFDRFNYIAEKVCAEFQIDEVKNAPKFKNKIMEILGVERNPIKLYEKFSQREIGDIVPYEDIFAILYIYFEIWGYPSFSHVKVVVIDEAQDYSMWQFEFLKRIFNQAVFTILGDKNQRVNPYIRYDSMEEITDVFKNSKYKKLFNTYRSSKEIIEYSNKILDLDGINSIRPSSGVKVVSRSSDDLKGDIISELERLHELGYKRIAVITKTAKEAKSLHREVGTKDEFIPVYLAKGLEYDAVIVATFKENAFTEEERSLFYVACTRALHALVVLNQEVCLK